MLNSIYKKIYHQIQKYDTIVIARHVGPDPDAVASEIALRDSIKLTFPKKNVYAVGDVADKRFKQAIVAAGYGCIAGLEIQEDN